MPIFAQNFFRFLGIFSSKMVQILHIKMLYHLFFDEEFEFSIHFYIESILEELVKMVRFG
jgi:hypothetical protein